VTDKAPAQRDSSATPHDTQKRWNFTPSAFALIVGVAVIVGYAAGTRNDQILAAVAPVIGLKQETGTLDLSSVQNTFRTLKSNFDGDLDEQALIQGASQGLVAASGDVHTQYFTEKEAKQFKDDLSGEIGGGIGAEIGVREDQPTVVRTLKDTPAERAGLKAGDQIAMVNDEVVGKQTVDQVVQKIRGEVGSTVKLTIVRDGEAKEFTITREEITSPSVESEIRGDVGILTITRFDEKTGETSRIAAQEFVSKGVKKVVLDLRDNGGGYLSAAPDVAGLWLDNKVVVSERVKNQVKGEQRSGNNALLKGLPTVVLVNEGTASASEIVTAALKEYGAISVVGEKTYGKGTVQSMVDLNDGALLKVTIQRWYTPQGKNLDKKGITPDEVVGLTKEDVDAERDPQLEAALSRLAK